MPSGRSANASAWAVPTIAPDLLEVESELRAEQAAERVLVVRQSRVDIARSDRGASAPACRTGPPGVAGPPARRLSSMASARAANPRSGSPLSRAGQISRRSAHARCSGSEPSSSSSMVSRVREDQLGQLTPHEPRDRWRLRLEGGGAGLVGQRPFDRGADVVVFPLDAGHRFGLVPSLHGCAGVGGQPPVVDGMSPAELLEGRLLRARWVSSVLGHRFQQPEASLRRDGVATVVTIDAQSTKRREKVKDLRGVHRLHGRGDRLRGGEVEVPGEHREPVEHELLRFVEQVVAPIERGSERLMPSIGGGGSIGERVEPVGEPVAEFGGAEDRGTGGGELDGQGDSVEVATASRPR